MDIWMVLLIITLVIVGLTCFVADEAQRLHHNGFFWAGLCFMLAAFMFVAALMLRDGSCSAGMAAIDYTLACQDIE